MKKFLTSFCLMLFAFSAWAQTRTITGQVIGATRDTLIGVIVVQKGTSNGTVTDAEGKFLLNVPDTSNVTLVFSYAGYKEKELAVGDQSEVVVSMEEDEKVEEVVVVGYGTVKKSDLTGSVASLKPKDVTQVPSGNVLDAIQGKAAGVDITRTSGEAGKAPNVVVRGTRSITAGNGPLYIVDGVQYSSIQDISPNDIQSMEVLKDPSSTAIYGSRGANGVIIVTTKKGISGEPRVTINSYAGVSSTLTYPRAMNGNEYLQFKREVYRTQNPTKSVSDTAALGGDEYSNYINGVQTDYTKKVLHHGAQKNLEVGISGGTEKLKSYFSLGYFNEKGLLENDNLNRYSARLNLDYQVKKYLRVGIQSQLTYYNQNKRANPLGNAQKISPLTRAFDESGNIIILPNGKHANPLLDEQANTAIDKLKTTRIFPTIYAEVTPFKGFKARTNLAINYDNRSEGIFNSANSYTVINNGYSFAQASHEANYRSQINWQGILTYNKNIGEDHTIGITGLSEVIGNKAERYFLQANNQLIAQQWFYNLGDNTSRLTNSRYIQSTLISFAGRLNYSFKGKYLLTMTGRSDGASVLAEGHKWDFFPSIAGGWRISDEKFMENQKLFSTLKLRTSWGITGNSNIDAYSTQSTLTRVPFSYDEQGVTAYVYRPQIGNTDTKWEKSKTVDVGLDFGLLKERVTATFDYYDTHTNGLLLTEKLPLTTGVVQTVSNIGKTRNRGVELTATSMNIQRPKFTWTTTLTFMRNKEQIVALANGVTTMQVTTVDDNGSQNTKTVVVGYPVNSFYDYEKVGIWQANEADEAAKYGQKPGMIHIKDQNGDGKITPEDRVVVGSSVPKWSAGFNSEFKFSNFDASFYLFSRVGQTINYQYNYDPSGAQNNLSTRDYWTPENPTNDLPRPGYSVEPQYVKTLNYTNGSFLKVRSVTVGYTLPASAVKKLGINRLRVYVTGKNLFAISKIKNYDPEMEGSLTFPTVRLIVGGVNFEF